MDPLQSLGVGQRAAKQDDCVVREPVPQEQTGFLVSRHTTRIGKLRDKRLDAARSALLSQCRDRASRLLNERNERVKPDLIKRLCLMVLHPLMMTPRSPVGPADGVRWYAPNAMHARQETMNVGLRRTSLVVAASDGPGG
jgi:hypothetical protein